MDELRFHVGATEGRDMGGEELFGRSWGVCSGDDVVGSDFPQIFAGSSYAGG